MISFRNQCARELMIIPGVGKSIAEDLLNIGINSVNDLRGQDPEVLYDRSNRFAGMVQDRCLLYCFRGAVYFAETPPEYRDPEKLKWWNWKDAGPYIAGNHIRKQQNTIPVKS
jgi:Pathogenicity locus